MVIVEENNPTFKWVIFAAQWELLRGTHKKMNQKSYRNCLFWSFSCRIWAVAVKKAEYAMDFF